MLTIVTWLWGSKIYSGDDVRKLRAGVKRHLSEPHRFVCVTDRAYAFEPDILIAPIWDLGLTRIRGCFARLRMFDPEWQAVATPEADRLVCMDLDSIVTGALDPLFAGDEGLMILKGANAANPCPYNGSLIMLRRGYYQKVWELFSLEAAEAAPKYEFADDQGWIWHLLPDLPGWEVGASSGVYAFQKPGWPKGDNLPADAKLVVFPGWRSPERFKHLPWVQQHWVM